MDKILEKIVKAPIRTIILIVLAIGFICGIVSYSTTYSLGQGNILRTFEDMFEYAFRLSLLLGCFVFCPIVLTAVNLLGLFQLPHKTSEQSKSEEDGKEKPWNGEKYRKIAVALTFVLGSSYTYIYLVLCEVIVGAEWWEQLYNSQVHQPVWTGGLFTVFILFLIGFIGYLILSSMKLEKMSPLGVVLCIASMYLGVLVCILWCIQVAYPDYWVVCVFPINCVMIYIRTIRVKIWEWNQEGMVWTGAETKEKQRKVQRRNLYPEKPLLNTFNSLLCKAELWPIAAFLLMWPLFGVLLCILLLFGQQPDAIIKAWTETAQWRLSQQIAPQNVMYDEHYLCTVAAGGHKRIVKPIRMGERHGHRVVVNRQLCIANAFEQILEERMPKFHKVVRAFYDTYGFPLSRMIRTKAAADVVYVLMKPLEWMFLMVIYLCEVKPENRIAVQYLPKRKA